MDFGYYKGQLLKGDAKIFRKAQFTNISIELENAVDMWKKYLSDPDQPSPPRKKWTAEVTSVEVSHILRANALFPLLFYEQICAA